MPPAPLDPEELAVAELRVLGMAPPVSPDSIHGTLAPPEAVPYEAPLPADERPGLLTRLFRTPSSIASTPFENQVTEVLAFLVDHSESFARTLCTLILDDGDRDGRAMLARSHTFGARTQVRMPPLPWAPVQIADLSIVDAGRHLQLIIEVKVGSPFGVTPNAAGELIAQPDSYRMAWDQGTLAGQARARRLGTITIDGLEDDDSGPASVDGAGRGRDVRWAEVIRLLEGLDDDPGIGSVAAELAVILKQRIAPTVGDDPEFGALRSWADEAIVGAVELLEAAYPHVRRCRETGEPLSTERARTGPNTGRAWTGCYFALDAPDASLVLWLYACTPGAGENQPMANEAAIALTIWSPRSVETVSALLGPMVSHFSTSPDRAGHRWPRAWTRAGGHRASAGPERSIAAWVMDVLALPGGGAGDR